MKRNVHLFLLIFIITIPILMEKNVETSYEQILPKASNLTGIGIFVNLSNAYQYEIVNPDYSKYVLIEMSEYIIDKEYGVYVDLPDYVVEIRNINGINLSTGIFVNNANMTIIRWNSFSNVSEGIELRNCLVNIVEHNSIENSIGTIGENGIRIYDSLGRAIQSSIKENEILYSKTAISVALGSAVIENNRINYCNSGIVIGGSGIIYSEIYQNLINNTVTSMDIGQISHSKIDGNQLLNTSTGIITKGSSLNTTMSNNLINCDNLLSEKIRVDDVSSYSIIPGSYGILLDGGSSSMIIYNNQIVADKGIQIWTACKENAIVSNSMLSYQCINDAGVNTTIETNLCKVLDRPKDKQGDTISQISGFPIYFIAFLSIFSIIMIRMH